MHTQGKLRDHGGSCDTEHVEVTSAIVVAAAMEPLTDMQRLCMHASFRCHHASDRKQLPNGRAGFKRVEQQQHFRGVTCILRICKSLQRRTLSRHSH